MVYFVITSSGGFGGAFLQRLLRETAADDLIYVFTDSHTSLRADVAQDSRLHILQGDVREIQKFRHELINSHYVYHVAIDIEKRDHQVFDEIHFAPTVQMMEVLNESSVIQNFVFVSTLHVLDRGPEDKCTENLSADHLPFPRTLYGLAFLKAEEALRNLAEFPYTIFRVPSLYGEEMGDKKFYDSAGILREKFWLKICDFPGKIPLIHTAELITALLRVRTQPAVAGQTYLAVTRNVGVGELCRQLSWAHRWRLPAPRWPSSLAHLHSYIPLSLASAMMDYMTAEDPKFISEFNFANHSHENKVDAKAAALPGVESWTRPNLE